MKIRSTVPQFHSKPQLRQLVDNLDAFDAQMHHTFNKIDDVAVVVVFVAPVVGIVGDATVFVRRDSVAFHDPFQCRFAVDDVLVCFRWDAFECQVGVVNDLAFVCLAGEFHLCDAVEPVAYAPGCYFLQRVHFAGFVVQVEVGQLAACLGKCPKIPGKRHTRQLLLEFRRETLLVLAAVQDAINVVKNGHCITKLAK